MSFHELLKQKFQHKRIEEIASICQKHDIFHLVNNAYGLQSTKSIHLINQAARAGGRVDLVVASTDKNLMVPVGGAIVAAFDEAVLRRVAQMYPGRASASQSLDVLITLLSMGVHTYRDLLKDRVDSYAHLKERLGALAEKYGEKLIHASANNISLGLSLKTFETTASQLTHIGSMLFLRNVSGIR